MTVASPVDSPGSPAAPVSGWPVGRADSTPASQEAAESSRQPGSQHPPTSHLLWLLPHLQQQRRAGAPARQPNSDMAGRVEAPTAVQPVPSNALKQLLALGQPAPVFQHSGAASAFQRPQPNPAPYTSGATNQAWPASQPAGMTAVQASQQGGGERSAAKRVKDTAPELSSGRVSAPMPVRTPPAAGPGNGTSVAASNHGSMAHKRGRGDDPAASPPSFATPQARPASNAGTSNAAKRQRAAPGPAGLQPPGQQRPATGCDAARARRVPLRSALAALSELQLAWAWRTYVAHYARRKQGDSSQLPPAALAVLASRMMTSTRAA
ncbi:hypothetical protein N2152v2_004622 [Parachlorella kessleri]